MTHTVIVWQIIDSYDSPYDFYWTVGRYIHCIYDDSDDSFVVEIRDASSPGSGTLITTPISGPSLFFGNGGVATRLTADPLYKYCSGTTLRKINPLNSFPYAYIGDVPNAVECQIAPVCDVRFSNDYTVIDSTGPGNADGSIQVSAIGSNGEIRFSLTPSFNYATASSSGLFTGLVAGRYGIYAKDAIGCTHTISISVNITELNNVKYRLEFDDIRTGTHRIDIAQRAYSGGITEVCGGATPLMFRYNLDLNNKYDSVLFSEWDIELLNDTAQQFIELFQGDDQMYPTNYYFNGVLKATGFIVPQFYSEPTVLEKNYTTTVKVCDNLATLQTFDYYDIDGNILTGDSSHLFIIQTILKKTGLELNLRDYVNLFENSMDQGDDDSVLDQAYIANSIFYDDSGTPNKSIEVLQKILKVYGAQLFQAEGEWCIRRVENSTDLLTFRRFDFEGMFLESGTTDTNLDLLPPRDGDCCWRDASQRLDLVQNYGKVTLINDLGIDNNFINSGTFELQYLKKNGSGEYFFEDWNIFQGEPGVRYGLEQVDNGDSKGALYIDYDAANPGTDTIVYTKEIPVVQTGKVFLTFQYQIFPTYNLPFIRLGVRVKIRNSTQTQWLIIFPQYGGFVDSTTTDDDFKESGYINDIYCSNYASWQDFETNFNLPVSSEPWMLEFSIFFDGLYGFPLSGDGSFTNLKDVKTSSRLQGIRRKYYLDNSDPSAPKLYDYLLVPAYGDEPESIPDLIQPLDYVPFTNSSKWRLQNTLSLGENRYVNKFLIDNVKISEKVYIFQPTTLLVDPPKTIEFENTPNSYNINKFSDTFYLGDAPTEIENSSLVYNGWIKLADGTPTTSWTRKDGDEDKLLIQILLEDYTAQLQDQTKKMSGNVLSENFVSYLNSITFEDEKYKIHGYSFDAKQVSYSLELLKVIVGDNGLPPPDITYEFTQEFTTEFNA